MFTINFYHFIKQIEEQSLKSFDEICENLSRIIQLRELRPRISTLVIKITTIHITLWIFIYQKKIILN